MDKTYHWTWSRNLYVPTYFMSGIVVPIKITVNIKCNKDSPELL